MISPTDKGRQYAFGNANTSVEDLSAPTFSSKLAARWRSSPTHFSVLLGPLMIGTTKDSSMSLIEETTFC